VLVFLVFAVGIYIRNRFFTYYIEIGLGLLIALFYPRLANLLKQRSSQNTSPS
jgi:lipopolysaccharide export LptBFGC system permease protein LptF